MEPSIYKRDLAYIQAAVFGDLASGAAAEIIRVLKSAPVPTGIDAFAELLKFARAGVLKSYFIHGSIYQTQIPSCEAIVTLREALTYHTDFAAADFLVENFFVRASEFRPGGGMLIFDVIELGERALSLRVFRKDQGN